MKKLFILTAISSMLFFSCGDSGDSVEPNGGSNNPIDNVTVAKENMSLITKYSGTNCPPCGTWGWTTWSTMISATSGEALPMTAYSQNFVAQLFITDEATVLDDYYGVTGYPSFGANGELKLSRENGGVNVNAEMQMMYDAVDAHSAAPVKVGAAASFEINEGRLKIYYKVKAYEDMSGEDLRVAVYVLEDKVIGYQAGHSEGSNASHKHILRYGVDGAWGKSIGGLAAGEGMQGEAALNINNDWNEENIEVVVVIYDENTLTFDFVNAAEGERI